MHAIRVCAGVLVCCLRLAACEKIPAIDEGNRTLVIDGDTVALESGVTMHDVQIRTSQGTDFEPARIQAKPGDVVRLTSADTRTHSLLFTAPTAAGAAMLSATGQHRSPPLVARGQAWVLSLKDLQPGRYVVSCISHPGTLTVDIR